LREETFRLGKQLAGEVAAFHYIAGRIHGVPAVYSRWVVGTARKGGTPPMNFQRICRRVAMFSGAMLLTGVTAVAQTNTGGMPPQSQQSPNPGMNAPGSNPDVMQQQQNSNSSAMADKDFVRGALQGGMAEVQLGQLAAQKGSSDDVKQFGQRMVDDHTKLGDQMKQVAQQLGVKPPDKLSKKDTELMAKLQGLSGTQFDNAYIEAMVKDHKKDANDFKTEAQNSQNPALQQVAKQGSEVIDQHLQMIEQIAQSHNLMNGKGKLSSGY
jgi:putative membrane protein